MAPRFSLGAATAAVVAFAASRAHAREQWAVKCSKACKGKNLCNEECSGEQTQIHACADLAPCDVRPRECMTGKKVDCSFTQWSQWTAFECSGLCERTRNVSTVNTCGGSACNGTLAETKACPDACSGVEECSFTDWSAWTTCGGGGVSNQRNRFRSFSEKHVDTSKCEGILNETQVCGTGVLEPKPCQLSEWNAWSACSKTCVGGIHTRLRLVVAKPENGGNPCDAMLSEIQPCGTEQCILGGIINCTLGVWSPWSECSPTSTQQRRQRIILVMPTIGGKGCNSEPLTEVQPCPFREAATSQPVNCRFSEWGSWSLCDQECGGGQTSRVRTIATPAQNGGLLCDDSLQETMPCAEIDCASVVGIPCRADTWSSWSACSTTCGTGMSTRSRTILNEAKGGGLGCNFGLSQARGCEVKKCEVTDCKWGVWADWEACTATCGGGRQTRVRSIVSEQTPLGKPCAPENASEMRKCAVESCEKLPECINGTWSEWGDWSECTKTCIGGFRVHTRKVAKVASACGTPALGFAGGTESCNDNIVCEDNVDCQLSDWSSWGVCSRDCNGVQNRTRAISVERKGHGKSCGTVSLQQMTSCGKPNDPSCPISKQDCKLSIWTAWSSCSEQCGGGQQSRSRQVENRASTGGGDSCGQSSLSEVQGCNEQLCGEKVDCQWSEWTQWGKCTGCEGQKHRTRDVVKLPKNGGTECAKQDAEEITACPRNCPEEKIHYCIWSDWSGFGACATTCGDGSRSRARSFTLTDVKPSEFAVRARTSRDCDGEAVDHQPCIGNAPCAGCVPQNCQLSAWAEWSTPNCEGICRRSRGVLVENNQCGKPCDAILAETKACQVECTATNCMLAEWSSWTQCSSSVDQRYMSRHIAVYPTLDGQGCENAGLNITGSCITGPNKPVHCQFSQWSEWSQCDATCGGGQTTRWRGIEVESQKNGMPCSHSTTSIAACNTQLCPLDNSVANSCQLTHWTEWTTCRSLKNQQVTRKRTVLRQAGPLGKACSGDLEQTRKCIPERLEPRDCAFLTWGDWSACDSTCGGGVKTRSRGVELESEPGGTPCSGPELQALTCNRVRCPSFKDCTTSTWSAWTACSLTCGKGYQTRERKILSGASGGGRHCTANLKAAQECQVQMCTGRQDCVWNIWSIWSDCVQAPGSCGVGFKWRNRDILKKPIHGGSLCLPLIREEVVPVEGCHGQVECCIDGKWADWGSWGACSASCGIGTHKRTRELSVKSTWCGNPPEGPPMDYAACDAGTCSGGQDCVFSEWSAPSSCSSDCRGSRQMTREIKVNGTGSGLRCTGEVVILEPCNPAIGEEEPSSCHKPLVPIDCVLEEWSAWTVCSATCNDGVAERSRTVKAVQQSGGKECDPILGELRPCHPEIPCHPELVNCEWESWTVWGACDTSISEKTRSRGIKIQEAKGGKPCEGKVKEAAPCGDSCAEGNYPCFWDDWTAWSACSATCGHGKRTRKRNLKVGDRLVTIANASASDSQAKFGTNAVAGLVNPAVGPQDLILGFVGGAFTVFALIGTVRFVSSRCRRSRHRLLDREDADSVHTQQYEAIAVDE
eukprot:TRINITY_DN4268_c5_g1_i1.p1 TRINITY_DN4268_c5_g1~~TRINITY_DN4268_c5_g1_i1.p1  ORF type:complete len:1573 (-),score=284.21 TRINITY_DN4268_c5_g1_i1:333-5015(-)